MRPKSIGRWLTACVLGSAVAGGCQSADPKPAEVRHPPMLSARAATSRTQSPATPVATAKSLSPTELAVATRVPPSDPIPPRLDLPPLEASKPAVPESPAAKPTLVPVHYEEPAKPAAPAEVAPSPVHSTTTSTSSFGHSEDYLRLSGQLQQFGRSWRLRYASLDEDDPHGGSVSLEADSRLEGFKDGQYVRVQGCLLEDDSRRGAPRYRITSIEAAQPEASAHP